jgi:hypothetical protein
MMLVLLIHLGRFALGDAVIQHPGVRAKDSLWEIEIPPVFECCAGNEAERKTKQEKEPVHAGGGG